MQCLPVTDANSLRTFRTLPAGRCILMNTLQSFQYAWGCRVQQTHSNPSTYANDHNPTTALWRVGWKEIAHLVDDVCCLVVSVHECPLRRLRLSICNAALHVILEPAAAYHIMQPSTPLQNCMPASWEPWAPAAWQQREHKTPSCMTATSKCIQCWSTAKSQQASPVAVQQLVHHQSLRAPSLPGHGIHSIYVR
jgi:hypothetical protein